jgi:hypothetical protein
MNRVATISILAALAIAPALAQQTSPTAPGQQQPPAASPTAPSGPSTTTAPATPSTSMAQTFIDAQSSDEWLASKLIGASVTGPANEKIGSVNDLLFTKEGNVKAAIIGVGGFLGIGEKNVAVSFNSLSLTRNQEGDKAVLKMSKAELEKAPDFKPFMPPRPAASPTTRPSGPAGTQRPQGGL